MHDTIRNLKIGTKLSAAFAIVVGLTAVVGMVGLASSWAMEGSLRKVYQQGTRPMIHLAELRGDFQAVRVGLRDMILESDPVKVAIEGDRVSAAMKEGDAKIAEFEPTIQDKALQEKFRAFREAWQEYVTRGKQVAALAAQNKDEEARGILVGAAKVAAMQAEAAIEDMVRMKVDSAGEEYATARQTGQFLLGATVVITLVGAGVAMLIGNFLTRAIRAPLAELKDAMRAIINGDLTHAVTFRSGCEFGTLADDFRQLHQFLRQTVGTLRERSHKLQDSGNALAATSNQLASTVEETTAKVGAAAHAAEEVNRSIQSIATGAEEMSATIKEGAKGAAGAASAATEAVDATQNATNTVTQLHTASSEIGEIVQVIAQITEQTNMLALNATIEAARAGESGRGFAVVANEVKQLAVETQRATRSIGEKIRAMQQRTDETIAAINAVSKLITRMSDANTQVANVVEEQSATASEMTRNMNEAARDSGEIAENLQRVSDATRNTSEAAASTRNTAGELSEISTQLTELVAVFRLDEGSAESAAATHGHPHEAATLQKTHGHGDEDRPGLHRAA